MIDSRINILAKNLVEYSCKLQKGQTIVIVGSEKAKELIIAIVRHAYSLGAYPFVRLGNSRIGREVAMGMTEERAKLALKYDLTMYQDAHAYIGIGHSSNIFESSDVPIEKKQLYAKHCGKPISDILDKKKWVCLRWPNPSMAQLAQTSVEKFEDFFFDVCNLDYAKMHKAMVPLKKLMETTDRVRIVAPDTDLTFSIKGQKPEICSGECNIPDGEIYTNPVRDSVNGKIRFNIPSLQKGIIHNNITLTFKDGKVVESSSSSTAALTKELDQDEGARFTGEFALGVNPFVTKPMMDTLFDEKMAMSIHIALGNGYPKNYGKGAVKNKSQIHWDIVQSHDPKRGGGEIYFDDRLIRKDGFFVLPELQDLNPDRLK